MQFKQKRKKTIKLSEWEIGEIKNACETHMTVFITTIAHPIMSTILSAASKQPNKKVKSFI